MSKQCGVQVINALTAYTDDDDDGGAIKFSAHGVFEVLQQMGIKQSLLSIHQMHLK